jgi:hypothetical protein
MRVHVERTPPVPTSPPAPPHAIRCPGCRTPTTAWYGIRLVGPAEEPLIGCRNCNRGYPVSQWEPAG